jgi:DNA repair exonuclease SbcCD ATPase subunit
MRILKSIELDNILYYKKAKFIFKPGITVVRGLNKNSKDIEKNTNGVGKSLLFSCIPNVRFATTPLAKKNDKKSLFSNTKGTSEIRLTFKDQVNTWTLIQRSRKTTVAYDILKNKESIHPRTVPIAESKIKELFGNVSEELFYTLEYISIQRPHVFLRGTATQRQEFFTEVFNLDHYDKLKANFLSQIRELKVKKVKIDVLKEQLVESINRLKVIDWDISKEKRINELETILQTTNADYVSHIATVTKLQSELHLSMTISKKKKKASTENTIAELKVKVKKLKTLISAVKDYAEYKRAKKKYEKDTASLQDRLDELTSQLKELKHDGSDEYSVKDIKLKLEKLNARRASEESRVESIISLRNKYTTIEESLPEKHPKLSLEQLGTRIGELEQIIELHGAVGTISKNCPLCGSVIEKSVFGRIAGDAEDELPRRKKELKTAQGYAKLKEIQKEAKEYKGCEDALADLEAKIKVLESKKSLVERSSRLQASIEDVTASLKQIRKPRSVDNPGTDKDEGALESELCVVNESIVLLEEIEELKAEQVRNFGTTTTRAVSEIEKEIAKRSKEQKKLSKNINKINEELPSLLSYQKQYVDGTSIKTNLESKIEKLERDLSDLPVLEALVKAYGSKGLKVDVMRHIGTIVEANLNKYRELLFAEPFVFSIKIEESSFEVIVDRGNGLISDVSKLSGAEGAAFILLLLLSMLPLIPRKLRSDTIILDECDAYLGPPLKAMYFNSFLPVLSTVVPKVVVITTAGSNLKIEGARNILIEKDGDTTEIKELYSLEGII